MAKEIILRNSNKKVCYPRTVSQVVYDNETKQTLKEITDSLVRYEVVDESNKYTDY